MRTALCAEATSGAQSEARPGPAREIGAFPLVGGDSDHGFGVGGFASYALADPENPPYKWSLEAGGFITFRQVDGNLTHPYQDAYLLGRHLRLWEDRLRLQWRVSWTRESALNFFGIGNASPNLTKEQLQPNRYQRTHPEAYVRARFRLRGPWMLEVGQSYAYNTLTIGDETRLAAAFAAPPEGFAGAFATQEPHHLVRSEVGLIWDSRDNELAATSGQFHSLQLRVSPGWGRAVPYGYEQVNLTSRFYRALAGLNVILAVRLVADLLMGDAPFYELARFEDTSAIGGVKGVRGVLAMRYHGKAKLFGNAELRFRLFDFQLFGKPLTLGAVTFFDGGRVWSDLTSPRALDGRGVGLKYGVGGGLRLLQGTTFVVRADLAWSPDAYPIAGYVIAGHMF